MPIGQTETHMLYVTSNGKVLRFPKHAYYRRSPDHVYVAGNFEDGEKVRFSAFCGNASNAENGVAWYYSNRTKHGEMVNINELEEMKDGDD